MGDVNIHEVCERVRSLILAEFPRGLTIVRDYDTSIPEFRGDREQLIQAVLNIAHNAAEALAERIAAGDAQHHAAHARRAPGDARQAALSTGTGIAYRWTTGRAFRTRSRDRIFFPLVSGREGGSGLGLTLAQTFVQQHHGTDRVRQRARDGRISRS